MELQDENWQDENWQDEKRQEGDRNKSDNSERHNNRYASSSTKEATGDQSSKCFACYMLVSDCSARTYIGATNCVPRRVRQHNGELRGGARATRQSRPWRVKATCVGFVSWKETLRFEWRWKRRAHGTRKTGILRGVAARLARAMELCESQQFQHVRLNVCSTEHAGKLDE